MCATGRTTSFFISLSYPPKLNTGLRYSGPSRFSRTKEDAPRAVVNPHPDPLILGLSPTVPLLAPPLSPHARRTHPPRRGVIDSAFQGERSYLLSLIRRSQRVAGVYIAYRCMEGVRERRDLYVRTMQWDVNWRAHCNEATREELAIVIWQDYSDGVNWNLAF
jgi:hypothetical protein